MPLSTIVIIFLLILENGKIVNAGLRKADDHGSVLQLLQDESDELMLPSSSSYVRRLQTNSTGRTCTTSPITPFLNGGPIVIDGSSADWRRADGTLDNKYFLANMFEAGNTAKDLLSRAYGTFDCNTRMFHVLVHVEGTLATQVETNQNNNWLKIYDVGNSVVPASAYRIVTENGVNRGWEASFNLATGSFSFTGDRCFQNVEIHVNVPSGRTSSTGKSNVAPKDPIALSFTCSSLPKSPPTQAPRPPPTQAPRPPPTQAPRPPPTQAPKPAPTPAPQPLPAPTSKTPPGQASKAQPTQAPVRPPTQAPRPPPTQAPRPAPTGAPRPPPTQAPRPPPTQAPRPPPTQAPRPAPTQAPRPPPTQAPRPPPTQAPRPPPTQAPRPPPTQAPKPAPTPAPQPLPVPTSKTPPGQASKAQPTQAPRPLPTQAPRPSPTQAPRPPPTQAPKAPPTQAPRPTPTLAPQPLPVPTSKTPPGQASKAQPTQAPLSPPTQAPKAPPTQAPRPAPTLAPQPLPAPTSKTPPGQASKAQTTQAPLSPPTQAPKAPPTRAPQPPPTQMTKKEITFDKVQQCLQSKWTGANKAGSLLCSSREVVLENVAATIPAKCVDGEMVTVSISGSIRVTGNNKNDLGWYVSMDGGDALEGQCMVNALREDQAYSVSAGSVTYNGDGDQCGDLSMNGSSSAIINGAMIASQLTMPCRDENEGGTLDFAVCFTWKRDAVNDNACMIASNIPGSVQGSCYCTRYDIPNVDVIVKTDPIAPCI